MFQKVTTRRNRSPFRKARKSPVVAALCLLACSVAPVAARDWVESVSIGQVGYVTPPFTVRADATGYTAVAAPDVRYQFDLRGECKSIYKAVFHYLYIERHSTGEEWWPYYEHLGSTAKSVSVHANPKVNLSQADKQAVIGVCAENMARLEAQGQSRQQILSQDHVVSGPTLYGARHAFYCGGPLKAMVDEESSEQIDVGNSVLCQKAPPGSFPEPPRPGSGDLQQVFGVTRAEVEVDPDHTTVVTRADLTVRAEIEANGAGRVRYRLVHNGTPSQASTLQFSRAKTWEGSWPLTVRCDQPQHQGSNGGGIGGLVGAPPSVRTGTVRIEILEPTSGVRVSEEAPYSVNCRETGDLATPQPDLTILDVRSSDASDNALVRVRNRGAANAPATQLAASRAGAAPTEVPVPAIAQGQQVEVQIPLPAAVGGAAAPVTFVVDPADSVPESDEGNNEHVQ